VVFCIRQFEPAWPAGEEFRARVTALAAEQNLEVRKLVVNGMTAYAAFGPPQSPHELQAPRSR
jgi:hypothetical protein